MPSVFEGLAQDATQQQIADTLAGTLTTVDATGTYVPLSAGGVDVAAGAEVQVVAATGGRVKVVVNHAGTAGLLWLGYGQTATAGVGDWLEPGGRVEEFYAGAVRVRNAGSTTVRVTFVEWGA